MQYNQNPSAAQPRFRRVQLLERRQLSPHLWRLTFYGPALAQLPHYWPACHIKLLLPKDGQLQPTLPVMTDHGPQWQDPASKPEIRTFSVRAHRPALAELDIDVAVHGYSAPASRFALTAQPCAHCALSEPGGPNPMLAAGVATGQPFLLAGDMTALPAICAMLETLPAASGRVFLLLQSNDDISSLTVPATAQCHWLLGDHRQSHLLTDAVKRSCLAQPLARDSFVWLAGEEQIVLQLRRLLRPYLSEPRAQLYAVPYWRAGVNESHFAMLRAEQAALAETSS